ncbi:MAG: tetratricopeptide repeat protein [Cyanobacteria bacterium HKST-UBA02]|nr:tetratricopeptide repeat protein [Cyanobacteria bacterium HKST-UBA02]
MKVLQILALFLVLSGTVQAVEAKPSEAAIRLVNERRYAKALPLMEQQVRINPNDVSAHYYMAVCLFALGRLDRAETEYCWVAYKGGHGDLKKKAQVGLAQLRKYKESLARARARQAPAAAKPAPAAAPRQTEKAPAKAEEKSPAGSNSADADNSKIDSDTTGGDGAEAPLKE